MLYTFNFWLISPVNYVFANTATRKCINSLISIISSKFDVTPYAFFGTTFLSVTAFACEQMFQLHFYLFLDYYYWLHYFILFTFNSLNILVVFYVGSFYNENEYLVNALEIPVLVMFVCIFT